MAVHVTQRSAVPCLCWGERGGEWNAGAILGHWLGVEEQAWTESAVYREFQIIIHNTEANVGSVETHNNNVRLGCFVRCCGITWQDPKSRSRLLA